MPEGEETGIAEGKPDFPRLRAMVKRGAARDTARFYTNGKMSWGKIGTESGGSRNRLESIRYGTGEPAKDTLRDLAALFGDDPQEWLEAGGIVSPAASDETMDPIEADFHRLRRGMTPQQIEAVLALMEQMSTEQRLGAEPPTPPPVESSH